MVKRYHWYYQPFELVKKNPVVQVHEMNKNKNKVKIKKKTIENFNNSKNISWEQID